MRVLHVMNGANWGGSYRFVTQLCAEQAAQGVDAALLYLEGGANKERVTQLGAKLLSYDAERTFDSKLERWADLARGYARVVEEYKPDLINSHLSLTHLLTRRIAPRKRGIKWVAMMHQSWRQFGYGPDAERRPWLKHYFMMKYGLGDTYSTWPADHITTCSEAVGRDCELLGIRRHRITNIYSGIHHMDPATMPNLRSEWGIPEDHRIIAGLGYFDKRKGFDQLLAAFDMIADRFPDTHVVVAGGDIGAHTMFREKLHAMRAASSYKDRIHILGEQASGAAFMFNADICAIPSIEEAFSLVVVEAMSFGKPSVVTSAGGCKDVARDGQESLVFQSCNIGDLAAKLARLLEDRDLAGTLGNAAAKRARTYLTMERVARDHIAVYEQILRSSSVK